MLPVLLLAAYLAMGFVVVFAGLLLAACGGTIQNRSNCLLYAFSRYYYEGGWIVIEPSRFGYWPHFKFTLDGVTLYEYRGVPRLRHRHRLPPIIYEGEVHVTKWPPKAGR